MGYSAIQRLSRDEHGSITVFVLVIFLTLVVAGGMGIDFMRHESERVALQDALDRGVLAAASFEVENEEVDIEERVISYIRASEFLSDRGLVLDVDDDITIYTRRVTVSGSYQLNTFFLKIIGINTLSVAAVSTAQTSRGEVEISLILDNSGSMAGSKMTNLHSAANNFIDLVLNDETVDHTTLSLIPFSAQVNAGPTLAAQYNLDTWHDYSYCFEFGADDYDTTALSTVTEFEQEQHFYRGNRSTHECPASGIVPFSNNPAVLHAAINAMEAGGYTATYAGMKWGTALLDPSSGTVLSSLITGGTVDPVFAGRPLAWDHSHGYKFVILMTDGANTTHQRIRPSDYNHEGTASWRSQANADYWDERRCRSSNDCYTRTVTNGSTGNNWLEDICDAAKINVDGTNRDRITVFTIGFAVSAGSNAYNAMRDCASSEANFYHVEDADLNSAFVQIASAISKLRLID